MTSATELGTILPSKDKKLLFVYGTLMRNFYNHKRFLGEAKFIKTASLEGYRMMACGTAFPAIFKSSDTYYRVYGEIFEVDDKILEATDSLEGVGNGFYHRDYVTTVTGENVIVYAQDPPKGQYNAVSGGEWKGAQTVTHQGFNGGYKVPVTPVVPQVPRMDAFYNDKMFKPALPNVMWTNGETDAIEETQAAAGP